MGNFAVVWILAGQSRRTIEGIPIIAGFLSFRTPHRGTRTPTRTPDRTRWLASTGFERHFLSNDGGLTWRYTNRLLAKSTPYRRRAYSL